MGTHLDPSILDLYGFQYTLRSVFRRLLDLYFSPDDAPNSCPDPYRGELVEGGQYYALIRANKDSLTASAPVEKLWSEVPAIFGSDAGLVALGTVGAAVANGGWNSR